MPRAEVRQAIADYLLSARATTPGLEILGEVFQHPPVWTSESQFFQNSWSGQAAGACIFVYLEEQSEERIALIGSLPGGKMRTYKVKLICLVRSVAQGASNTDSAQVADATNDTFLDALVVAIQSNRQPGGPSVVFQWGEGDTVGGVDINVTAGWPAPINSQLLQVYSTVEVLAQEIIQPGT